uniref:Uncharacterized protein n=1 Tax=Arundo donax TaxID=35708 RepID=A0A0A9HHK6_ARUDO
MLIYQYSHKCQVQASKDKLFRYISLCYSQNFSF